MDKRTGLYKAGLVLFPLAFVAFVVGFGTPVWMTSPMINSGLWQVCKDTLKGCTALDFDEDGDWMVGIRGVEIFALVMLSAAAAEIAYENCVGDFSKRSVFERLAPGILCILGGFGGLSGIIVYTVKTTDGVKNAGVDYGWSMMLVAAGSALAALVGVGFCSSGLCLEHPDDDDKLHINGYGPGSYENNYEMTSFSNKGMTELHRPPMLPARHSDDQGTHYASHNGFPSNQPGHRHSLPPLDTSTMLPSYSSNRGLPNELNGPRYFTLIDDRVIYPNFDLSEGYLPSRPRSYAERPQASPYVVNREEDRPIASGRDHVYPARMTDPYTRAENPSSYGLSRTSYSGPSKTNERMEDKPARRVEEGYSRGYSDGYLDGRESAIKSGRF